MALITKEVEITLHGENISFYERLGYYIPREYSKEKKKQVVKRGTKIKVKVEDLQKGSNVIIEFTCDKCGKKMSSTYSDYRVRLHENGERYCKSCANGIFLSGENSHFYNPNLSEEDRLDKRNNYNTNREYIKFKREVLKRDNYLCRCCGSKEKLQVHHIINYKKDKQRRTDITNGITLCYNCHRNFHNTYGKYDNNINQLKEFLNNSLNFLNEENKIELPSEKEIYCFTENKFYKSSREFCIAHNMKDITQVQSCARHTKKCKTVRGHIIIYKDIYDKMTDKEKEDYVKECLIDNKLVPIICLNDMKEFKSIADATRYYGFKYSVAISKALKNNKKYIEKNGIKYRFMYLKDYNKNKEVI